MKSITIQLVLAFLLLATPGRPQASDAPVRKYDYKFAIGIRAGSTSGLTFKHLMNRGNAVELIAGLWPNAVGLTGLYEKHVGSGISSLRFYYGAGLHFTVETNHYLYRRPSDNGAYAYRYGPDGWGAGVDGIVGIEYKIPVIPVALSFDLKPYVEATSIGYLYTAIDPGLGIKFAF
jgi:hypothetical protein